MGFKWVVTSEGLMGFNGSNEEGRGWFSVLTKRGEAIREQ